MPEEAYHYLFENASDAIWIHNLEGDIVYANKACEKLNALVSVMNSGVDLKEILDIRARNKENSPNGE